MLDVIKTQTPLEVSRLLEERTFVKKTVPKVKATKRIVSVAKGITAKIVEPSPRALAISTMVVNTDRPTQGSSDKEIEAAAHLITNVIKVPTSTKDVYAKNLQGLTAKITEFLLLEIAPYESALDAALSDAGESIQLMTGVQQADFSLGRAESLLKRIPELKTLDWVCKLLEMPDDIRLLIIQDYMGVDAKSKPASSTDKLYEMLSRTWAQDRQQRRPRPVQPAVDGRKPKGSK